ncbi:MAG: hypothetical protein QM775_15510 [Pirellulales bacterium]
MTGCEIRAALLDRFASLGLVFFLANLLSPQIVEPFFALGQLDAGHGRLFFERTQLGGRPFAACFEVGNLQFARSRVGLRCAAAEVRVVAATFHFRRITARRPALRV